MKNHIKFPDGSVVVLDEHETALPDTTTMVTELIMKKTSLDKEASYSLALEIITILD